MIKKIADYLSEFEEIEKKSKINIEYLPKEPTSYSIMEEAMVNGGLIRKSITGNKLKQKIVTLLRTTEYEEPIATNIDNSNFFRNFEKWIENNNEKRIFPNIDGVQSIEIISSGYLQGVSQDQTSAIYGVGIKIIYLERKLINE